MKLFRQCAAVKREPPPKAVASSGAVYPAQNAADMFYDVLRKIVT